MKIEAWLPDEYCPVCGMQTLIPVVDVVFGVDKGQQVSPARCESCGWVSKDCQAKECSRERCGCWYYCVGMSLGG